MVGMAVMRASDVQKIAPGSNPASKSGRANRWRKARWPGLPRRLKRSASAWKSTCIIPPTSAKTTCSEAGSRTANLTSLRILILGSAAGGGLPQWNCGCRNCIKARRGEIPSRSQSSIAVSADGAAWAIINASPDIRAQLTASPALHPSGPRTSPLCGVLLTNGDIDHVAGLLTLREQQPFVLFSPGGIAALVGRKAIFRGLGPALG